MADRRIGGRVSIQVNGETYLAKGSWTYNLGVGKKEAVVGADSVHGYKEMPQVPFIAGTITDQLGLDVKALRETVDATITLSLANGKVISLFEAWESSDGEGSSEEGELDVRFEGITAREIVA